MRHSRQIKWAAIPLGLTVALVLAGCTQQELNGYLPGGRDITNQTDRITTFWVNSWIILLIIGLITWGLMFWAMIVYRRRKNQTGLPPQMKYNLPIEVFFTVVPFLLIIGFFAFTAKDEAIIEEKFQNPDVTIQAFGKQWAWDFNYVDANTYSSGIQVQPDLSPGAPQGSVRADSIPTLYLPVGKKVEIQLEARDVIHSFWVIDFLYKKDMIPGKTNYMSVIPEREGTYAGKCAELCGEFHSQMLFQVKVVSQSEFDAQMQKLRDAGFSGQLGPDYNRLTQTSSVVAAAGGSETK